MIVCFHGHPVAFSKAARWPTFSVGLPRADATPFSTVAEAREYAQRYASLREAIQHVTVEPR